jgi:hypothetical protein
MISGRRIPRFKIVWKAVALTYVSDASTSGCVPQPVLYRRGGSEFCSLPSSARKTVNTLDMWQRLSFLFCNNDA